MLSQRCQSISLERTATVRARWNGNDSRSIEKAINLDTLVGNSNGRFSVPGRMFSVTAKNVRLEGFTLHADLEAYSDRSHHHDTLALDGVLAVDKDELFPRRGKMSSANADICDICRGFPVDNQRLGISSDGVSFSVPVKRLKQQNEGSECEVCHLLWRITDHLSKQDPRHANPDTICSGGTPDEAPLLNAKQHAWIKYTLNAKFPLDKKYYLYKEKGVPMESITFERVRDDKHVGFDPMSDATLKQVQAWISQCVKKHPKCNSCENLLPTRILDLGTQNSDTVKLILGGHIKAKYACVSYSWGDAVGAQLREDNFQEFTNGVKVASLPRTYRDAIVFCRRVSIRYLWIDALCIKQKNKIDWSLESVKMAEYYGGCYLCLTATSSASLDAGCNASTPITEFKGVGQDGKHYRLFVRPETYHIGYGGDYNNIHFPLLTRAWCYQERRLATRVLHFCGEELLFECAEMIACQCGTAGKVDLNRVWTKPRDSFFVNHKDISTTKDEKAKALYQWHAYVSAFSSLAIRYPTDKLVAVAGLAKRVKSERDHQGISSGRYLAGLWENRLIEDMSWCVGKDLTRIRNEGIRSGFGSVLHPEPAKSPRPKDYCGPPWSWASVQDSVQYNVPLPTPLCSVVSAETTTTGDNEWGPVTGGYIVLRAKVKVSRWEPRRFDGYLTDIRVAGAFFNSKGLKWFPDYAEQGLLERTPELFLMPLASRARGQGFPWLAKALSLRDLTVFLVLRRKVGDTYERVGWTYLNGKEVDMEDIKESKVYLE